MNNFTKTTIYSIIFLVCIIILTNSIFGINFGDPSPDTGEADYGSIDGFFNTSSGTFVSTQTQNGIDYSIGRDNGDTALANQTLGFNVTDIANATSVITDLNFTLIYCHARQANSNCNGAPGQSPQGTAGKMNVYIENATAGTYIDIEDVAPTTTATLNLSTFNVSNFENYSEFVNESGFINIIFEFVWSGTGRSSFLNDHTNLTVTYDTAPTVTLSLPENATAYHGTTDITFECNTTDDMNLVNVTLYHDINGTFMENQTIGLNGTTNSTQFTVPNVPIGGYNWTCEASDGVTLDTLADQNYTVFVETNLSIIPLGCDPLNPEIGGSSMCNASIASDVEFTGFANVTLPNGTVDIQSVLNISDNYYFNFTNTGVNGTYNVTWFANDTTDNTNSYFDSFSIADGIPPTIVLSSPDDYYNSSSSDIDFKFIATDNLDSLFNCSIILDNIINQTNGATISADTTTMSVLGLESGSHQWYIECNDLSNNQNDSETRNLTIDLDEPNFFSLTTDPNDEDLLDPGVIVTVNANITDNTTAIDTIILQYKLNTTTDYTNITMDLLDSGFYNTSFNASDEGGYNLRLFANDTVGNYNYSSQVNISVLNEKTWTYSPLSIPASGAVASQEVSTILTLNNTGDIPLDFTVTSDYFNSSFNETFPLAIAAGSTQDVNITANASATNGVTEINLTLSTSDGIPLSTITTWDVIVSEDAFLASNIISYPTSVTQGEKGISIQAQLENVGQLNATNVTFFYILPTGWTITSGNQSIDVGDLEPGDIVFNFIEVSIDNSAPIDLQEIIINSTGQNESGTDLDLLGNIYGDSVSINVESAPIELTTAGIQEIIEEVINVVSGGGTDESGGGGGGNAISVPSEISIVRGSGQGAPLSVSNPYPNTYMTDVKVEVQGFMSQYIKVEPFFDPNELVYVGGTNFKLSQSSQPKEFSFKNLGRHTITPISINNNEATFKIESNPITTSFKINETKKFDLNNDSIDDIAISLNKIAANIADLNLFEIGKPDQDKIYYLQNKTYSINLFVPPYLQQSEYNLTIKITADVIPFDPKQSGFKNKIFSEIRNIKLLVYEYGQEFLGNKLNEAKDAYQLMLDAGFGTEKVRILLINIDKFLTKNDYKSVLELENQILNIKDTAFEANNIIKEIEANLKDASNKWLKVPTTLRLYDLSKIAFEREDFEGALERAKEARLTYVLEAHGKINILWFITYYWWALLIASFVLTIITLLTYQRFIINIINFRINNLNKESTTIDNLIKKLQNRYIKERTISPQDYHKSIENYEMRLNNINNALIKLRNKNRESLSTSKALVSVNNEYKELIGLIKKYQTDYLIKGEFDKKHFEFLSKAEKLRLAEIEGQQELLREKLKRESKTKKYIILNFLDLITSKINHLIEFRKRKKRWKDLKNKSFNHE